MNYGCENWRDFVPIPVFEENPAFLEFYMETWECAYKHIKDIPGLPQTPYMDEAFCETQLWIWDSCFMALFCKYARDSFPGVETLRNFYEVLYNGRKLPEIIPGENEPDWTGAVAGKPYEIKVHIADNPPLFAWAEYENALMSGEAGYIKTLLYDERFLQKHYEWIEGLRKSEELRGVFAPTCLIAEKNGYKWEGGRSGMDNTPRGRLGEHAEEARPNNPDMLWLDAICQQALSARMISKMFALVEDKENEAVWNARFIEKKEIVNRLYWDEKDRFYYDIDCNSLEFYKVKTIASFWTLTSEIASKEQAESLVKLLADSQTFGGTVPFVSLARNDADFKPDGGYWRGSVWLPTAYAALRGLANYGFYKEAREAAMALVEHMYKTYTDVEPHTIWECYSPEKPEPATNEHRIGEYVRGDFCGWSALGPISIYIEFILGFHKIDAFEKIVEWQMPEGIKGKFGIKNLRFGKVITDIEASGNRCYVRSNEPYVLRINGREYPIAVGENEFEL